MTTLTDRCDEAMADAVLADLLDRRGIRQMLEEIKMGDPEVWKDIREAIGPAARLALLSELDAAGWRVVPKVATEVMVIAGGQALSGWIAPAMHSDVSYTAMLSAAPHPFPEDKP